MLAKEPTYGYELRARLRQALGPVGEDLNAGQIYVTLTRLEKVGLVTATAESGQVRPDRRATSSRRRAAARGHRAPAAGGPALARGMRTDLDYAKEPVMTALLAARALRKTYGR